ncbi:MAG TPA: nitronate monooxygenase, partial [Acidimicrobiales bacterium]|nr:nitronate monooxygenase [Acidimicrobiales bacterium]
APMGGGPSTPELVAAAAEAGALGSLAAGYKTAEAMQAEIEAVRALTSEAFAVNVFVPGRPAGDQDAVRAYVRSLQTEARGLGVELADPAWDDDDWDRKLEVLLAVAPPIVSFTFGCPDRGVISALSERGCGVAVTVTTPDEASTSIQRGANYLCAQGFEAGGHRGSFADDDRPGQDHGILALVTELADMTDLPVIGTGGVAGPRGVAALLTAGATAVQMGTAFLRCPESGASSVYKDALVDRRYSTTAITRAFSGRRARGLLNRFMVDHAGAPSAYPEINSATRPLRAAAAASGDSGRMSLWAGQRFRAASDRPVGDVIEILSRGLPT